MVNLNNISDNSDAELTSLNTAIQSSKQQANLYAKRAMIFLRQQETEKALKDATEAVRLSKNAPEYLFLKAQVLRTLKREGEALQFASKAKRNGYENELLYTLLADLFLRLGQHNKARHYTDLAYNLAPSDAYVLYYRGRVAAVREDTAAAFKSYQKGLEDAPALFELNRELAGLYVAGKDSAQAVVYLNRARRLKNKDGLLWYHQGGHYKNSGKIDSAIWSYNKAIAVADTLLAAHYQLGYLLYARGNYNLAIPHFEKATGKYGRSVRFLTTFASSYERTGQDQKALEQYQKLVKLEPTYYYAQQKVNRIKNKLARTRPDSLNTAEVPVEIE